jgi:hypothetical protein
MPTKLYKWLFLGTACFFLAGSTLHPIFVSVTEMELNSNEKTLELSCKLFTNDFEKALRTSGNTRVDLINPANKGAMDKLINEYVQKHLKVSADGRLLTLRYLGYEIIEEGVYSYFESPNIEKISSMSIFNNLLYENNPEQIGLMHLIINGVRKSTQLSNPNQKATIQF